MLDEPSNFLDREALGGLAVAIKEWAGAVVRSSFFMLRVAAISDVFAVGYHLTQQRIRFIVMYVIRAFSSDTDAHP